MRAGVAVLCVAASVATAMAAVPAMAADESMSAQVTTSHPTVGKELDITGQVTGAMTYPVAVTTTRDDSSGTATPVGTMPVMSDGQGNFTVMDTPPARGSVTYHLSADAGAATADVTTTVAGKKANLSIHVSPAPADAESSVRVTAHLGADTTNREVALSLRPYRGSKQEFDRGQVDASGDRTAAHAVHRRTTFIATFDGDSAYAPASVQTTLRVRAVIDEKLRGGYATRHGYRLYRRGVDVQVFLHMLPESKGRCLIMRAQRHYSGAWHNTAVSDCGPDAVRTNSSGEVVALLQGKHTAGQHYRLRAQWRGNRALAARNGAWLHLEFRN